MFDTILSNDDASRATSVVNDLLAHGFRGSLTGGLAVEAHLCARGRRSSRRPLNDIDFVVEGFASIPQAVANRFLLNHVHPFAPAGKTLLQLIDPDLAVRVDIFRAAGATLSRSAPLGVGTEPLDVVAVEDLLARTTAHVYSHLRDRRVIDPKYVRTFLDLSSFGSELALEQAWHDHRGAIWDSFREASSEALRLLALRPELVITERRIPL